MHIHARFKMEVVYFMTPSGEHGVPQLGPNEYWFAAKRPSGGWTTGGLCRLAPERTSQGRDRTYRRTRSLAEL